MPVTVPLRSWVESVRVLTLVERLELSVLRVSVVVERLELSLFELFVERLEPSL